VTIRSVSAAVITGVVLAATFLASAFASSNARPATRSERSAIVSAFTANDGNSSEVRGVYVSRSNSRLAVVCARTPEAGTQAFVFDHVQRSWRYVTSGRVGRAGNAFDRSLEQACG
jgi:hypothetical protein